MSHIHARHQNENAIFSIPEGEIIEGNMKKPQIRLVQAWITLHDLEYEVFRALKDEKMFNSVRPFIGTIQWANEADLCPDTVYLDSVKISH